MAYQLVPDAETAAAPPKSPLAAAHAKLLEAETARRNGQLDRAQALCESLLQEHSGYVGALQTLGVVQLNKKNYWAALSCFTKAAIQCPRDWTNLTNLATVYVELGGKELATLTLEQARRLKPDDAEIYATMGGIYREEREYVLAAEAFQQALKFDPDHAVAALGLGESHIDLGQYADAAVVFEKLHKMQPQSIGCLYGLTQLPPGASKIDVLAALGKAQKRIDTKADDDLRTHFAFTRAAALHRKGRHREAWESLLAANRSDWAKHEADYRKDLTRRESHRKAALELPPLSQQRRPADGGDCPKSLFILGVSRSGKTTLESLAGTLDGVKRGYESHCVNRAARRASQTSGLLTITHLSNLPKPLDGEFTRFYREELKDAAGGAKIFTSTNPGMIPSAGRVAAVVPDSRFVFVKRDAHDIALRIFFKRYKKSGNHYAYDLEAVFEYVAWYYEMVDIWLEKLAPVARVVHYEEMIADPRAALQTVADLCAVPLPAGPLPQLGDDRGCSAPYREFIAEALGN